ncbi:hypothetical protein Tco_1336225 [Tanacetum coccineum]
MNVDQDKNMLMVDDNVGNQFRQNAVQNVGHLVGQNAVQNHEEKFKTSSFTVKPRKRDAAYLQTQLQITQKMNQQASTSGTQSDKALVYDSDGSAEQYIELLEPIPEPHQVQQNDSNVISVVSSVKQSGETVEQHPVNVDETRVLYDSLYNNLVIEVEKVNSVNRKLRETNTDLTSELAR